MLKRVTIMAAYGLFLFIASVGVVKATDIGVSPVRVELSDNQKMGAITLRNAGTEPVSMQLEVLNWSQAEGEDVLTPTREMLANPPIFTIPAGGSQLVRIGLRRAPDAKRELTYRIILQELPPPPSIGFNGTRMLMRVSIPVFVLPELIAKTMLRWQAELTSTGALKISITNNGNTHIQIGNLNLSLLGKSQPWITHQTSLYVLPGQSRDVILPYNTESPTPPPGTTLQLIAQTDAGDIEAEILIAP